MIWLRENTQTTFFGVYQFTTLKGNHTRIGSENRAMFVSSRESLLTFGQKRTLSCEAGEPMGLWLWLHEQGGTGNPSPINRKWNPLTMRLESSSMHTHTHPILHTYFWIHTYLYIHITTPNLHVYTVYIYNMYLHVNKLELLHEQNSQKITKSVPLCPDGYIWIIMTSRDVTGVMVVGFG